VMHGKNREHGVVDIDAGCFRCSSVCST
jgi:hypothetical protein